MEIALEAEVRVSERSNLGRIRVYNVFMGLLHLIQGIVVILISNDFSVKITTSYLKFNPADQTLSTATSNIFDVRFGYWVAGFFFLSALFHLIISSFYYKRYVENLAKGINKARWIEYSLSASLMIVLIGMLSGIYDFSTLLLMFGATAVMNLCGLVMELVNQKINGKIDWSAFWVGCLAGILPWVVFVIYFIGAERSADTNIPTFVYWIYGTIFVFFNIFALNMYLQYKKVGAWKKYLFGEKMYILLSLIAKSALAWQIFAGTLRPN